MPQSLRGRPQGTGSLIFGYWKYWKRGNEMKWRPWRETFALWFSVTGICGRLASASILRILQRKCKVTVGGHFLCFDTLFPFCVSPKPASQSTRRPCSMSLATLVQVRKRQTQQFACDLHKLLCTEDLNLIQDSWTGNLQARARHFSSSHGMRLAWPLVNLPPPSESALNRSKSAASSVSSVSSIGNPFWGRSHTEGVGRIFFDSERPRR